MVEFCKLEMWGRLAKSCQIPRDALAGQWEQQLLDLIIVGKYFCPLWSRDRPLTSRVGLTPRRLIGVSLLQAVGEGGEGGQGGGGAAAQVESSEASLYCDRLLLP